MLPGDFNDENAEYNNSVPETVSYSELHPADELHPASELHVYSEFGKGAKAATAPKTLVASRTMNEALKYSTQVATVIKAVAVVTAAAVVVGVPLLDLGSNISLEFLDYGADDSYVYYKIEIQDFNEDMNLTVSVHNDFINRSKPIESSIADGFESGLQPNMEYKITVYEGSRTVAEKTVWTKKVPTQTEPRMYLLKEPYLDRSTGKLKVDFNYVDPLGKTYEDNGIKAVVYCPALGKDAYAMCNPSDGTLSVDVEPFIGFDVSIEISYIHKDDPTEHTVLMTYDSYPMYMSDSKIEITGVHLEGSDRDKLYLDMDYLDDDRVFGDITVDVFVSKKMSVENAVIMDIDTNPYVTLVSIDVGSENDEIDITIHYSRHAHDDPTMVPQPDIVYEGLNVPFVRPIISSMNSIERNIPTNVRFYMYVDDPNTRWSDYTATAYYITKNDRETHVPIDGVTFSKVDSDCSLTLPTSVPQYNAAIYMTLTCTETAPDSTTSTVTVFSDVVVPTVFVEFPSTMNDNNPFGGNGDKINFTVTDYIGLDESMACTVSFDYREVVAGVETGSTEKFPDPMDTPVNFTGTGHVVMEGFDTVTSYSEGNGYMNVYYSDPSYGSLMLISDAYIDGFRISQG